MSITSPIPSIDNTSCLENKMESFCIDVSGVNPYDPCRIIRSGRSNSLTRERMSFPSGHNRATFYRGHSRIHFPITSIHASNSSYVHASSSPSLPPQRQLRTHNVGSPNSPIPPVNNPPRCMISTSRTSS